MKLLIISHTPHYIDKDGTVKGLGPTVLEINYLSQSFDQIIHIGILHKENPPESSQIYLDNKVTFIALPPFGGITFMKKIKMHRITL